MLLFNATKYYCYYHYHWEEQGGRHRGHQEQRGRVLLGSHQSNISIIRSNTNSSNDSSTTTHINNTTNCNTSTNTNTNTNTNTYATTTTTTTNDNNNSNNNDDIDNDTSNNTNISQRATNHLSLFLESRFGAVLASARSRATVCIGIYFQVELLLSTSATDFETRGDTKHILLFNSIASARSCVLHLPPRTWAVSLPHNSQHV